MDFNDVVLIDVILISMTHQRLLKFYGNLYANFISRNINTKLTNLGEFCHCLTTCIWYLPSESFYEI